MIEEAEANALVDKSKKSLVNITYEFDNLLSKIEPVLKISNIKDKTSYICCDELIKTLKSDFKSNKFETIANMYLSKLDYAYSVYLIDFFKDELASTQVSKRSADDEKSVVIDVTEE